MKWLLIIWLNSGMGSGLQDAAQGMLVMKHFEREAQCEAQGAKLITQWDEKWKCVEDTSENGSEIAKK
jgi:hypothetical protein